MFCLCDYLQTKSALLKHWSLERYCSVPLTVQKWDKLSTTLVTAYKMGKRRCLSGTPLKPALL